MTTQNTGAADGVTSRVSFPPDDLPNDPDTDISTTPVPPPPPPDVDPVTLKLAELQSVINKLSPDELREHLTENPDVLNLLVAGLHQTGGLGFLETLKRLRDLDALPSEVAVWVNGYDLATSRAQPDTPGGSWTPPTRIVSEPKPLPDLPLPDVLRPYVEAVAELAGSSIGTAHSAVVGSINLPLADSIEVESLAADVHPASLFMLTSARTGYRKTAAFNLAWRGHTDADNLIHRAWMAARKTKGDKPKGDKPKGDNARASLAPDDLPGDKPRTVSPIAVRDDSTAEALMANLAEGRRTQALASAEAGVVLGGWSFGKGQSGQTLAKLNGLYSGEGVNYERITGRVSIRVADARLTVCLMMQPDFASQHILSDAAQNGFSARSLLNRDIARPQPLTFEWPVGTSARYYVDLLHKLIARLRRDQDAGTQFVDSPRLPPMVMRPTAGARTALREFLAQCQAVADDGNTDAHELGFLERATEQVARYAAMLAAFRSLTAGETLGDSYTEADVKDAAAVINWHRLNLVSFSQEADDARYAKAAEWAAVRLRGWTEKSKAAYGGISLLSVLGRYAAGDAKFIKDDPDGKRRVMLLLEEYGYTRPLPTRGNYLVNPLDPEN